MQTSIHICSYCPHITHSMEPDPHTGQWGTDEYYCGLSKCMLAISQMEIQCEVPPACPFKLEHKDADKWVPD